MLGTTELTSSGRNTRSGCMWETAPISSHQIAGALVYLVPLRTDWNDNIPPKRPRVWNLAPDGRITYRDYETSVTLGERGSGEKLGAGTWRAQWSPLPDLGTVCGVPLYTPTASSHSRAAASSSSHHRGHKSPETTNFFSDSVTYFFTATSPWWDHIHIPYFAGSSCCFSAPSLFHWGTKPHKFLLQAASPPAVTALLPGYLWSTVNSNLHSLALFNFIQLILTGWSWSFAEQIWWTVFWSAFYLETFSCSLKGNSNHQNLQVLQVPCPSQAFLTGFPENSGFPCSLFCMNSSASMLCFHGFSY